jgi:hypothetical protein
MPESGTYGSVRGVPGDGHPYRDPCCTPAGADPDTNRSAGLHSIAVVGHLSRHAGLVEFTGCRSDLSMHLREHVFGGRLLVD